MAFMGTHWILIKTKVTMSNIIINSWELENNLWNTNQMWSTKTWVVKYLTRMGYRNELVVKVIEEYSKTRFKSSLGFIYFNKSEILPKLGNIKNLWGVVRTSVMLLGMYRITVNERYAPGGKGYEEAKEDFYNH